MSWPRLLSGKWCYHLMYSFKLPKSPSEKKSNQSQEWCTFVITRIRFASTDHDRDLRALIKVYLHHHYELNSDIELIRMQQRAKAYQIIGDELYKTSVTGPLLHCLSRDEGKELLTQIHSGVCGGHIGARALTTKVFRQGFYWPSIIDDASKLVITCQACQRFSPNTQALSQPS
jgi:hypothetical protein